VLARVLTVWVGAVVVWRLLDRVSVVWFGDGYSTARHASLAAATSLVAVPLLVLVVRRVERRSLADAGIDPRGRALAGVLWGAAAALVPVVPVLVLLGVRSELALAPDVRVLDVVLLVASLVVLVGALEALPEELVFRGHVQTTLASVASSAAAVVAQAGLFTAWGAAIGAAGSFERVTVLFVVGLALGVMRAVTGTVWVAVGFHTVFQTAQQAVRPVNGLVEVVDPDLVEFVGLGVVPLAGGVLVTVALGRRRRWRHGRTP
jgi:membrane protease YdiL (CAAX protease family)